MHGDIQSTGTNNLMIQNNSSIDLQARQVPGEQGERLLNLLSKLEEACIRHRTRWQGNVSGQDKRITSAWPSLQWSQAASLVNLMSRPKHQQNAAVNTYPLPPKTHREAAGICYFDSKNQTKGGLGLSPPVPTVLYLLQYSRHLPWGAARLTHP